MSKPFTSELATAPGLEPVHILSLLLFNVILQSPLSIHLIRDFPMKIMYVSRISYMR